MKKIILSAVALSAISVAAENRLPEGFYVGAKVGGEWGVKGAALIDGKVAPGHKKSWGALGGLFGGYAKNAGDTSFAMEIGVTGSTLKKSLYKVHTDEDNQYIDYKPRFGIEAAAKLAYAMGEWAPFVRLGIEYNFGQRKDFVEGTQSQTRRVRTWFWKPGLGIMYAMSECMTVSVGVDAKIAINNTYDKDNPGYGLFKRKPVSYIPYVGVAYHF